VRERGQHHQQHQVGERTTSSISSWNTDWCIYKSSKVFFIENIIILKGISQLGTQGKLFLGKLSTNQQQALVVLVKLTQVFTF